MSFSWSKGLVTDSVYEESLRLRLLEEVDVDSVDYSLSSVNRPSLVFPSALLAGCTVAVWRAGFPLLATVSSIGLASAAVLSGCFLHSLRSLPSDLSLSLVSARSLRSSLNQRRQLLFSLGLGATQSQALLQFRVFLSIRRLIFCLREASQGLAHPLGSDESSHLLVNFYTAQMSSLMTEVVEESSPVNLDSAISTLLDLALLHTSELCRLYLLRLKELSFGGSFSLLTFVHSLRRRLKQWRAENSDILQSTRTRVVQEAVIPKAVDVLSAEVKVAAALDDIASGIWSQSLSLAEARSALQQVLAIEGLSQSVGPERPVEKETEAELKIPIEGIISQAIIPSVDQVFEGVVDAKSQMATSEGDEWLFPEHRSNHCSLMGELRVALGGRSRDFEIRERRALAAFYGVSEEEIEKREKEETQREEEKERHLEAMGVGVDGVERPTFERRVAPLPSDLMRALALRPRQTETAIGDSSSDEEDAQ